MLRPIAAQRLRQGKLSGKPDQRLATLNLPKVVRNIRDLPDNIEENLLWRNAHPVGRHTLVDRLHQERTVLCQRLYQQRPAVAAGAKYRHRGGCGLRFQILADLQPQKHLVRYLQANGVEEEDVHVARAVGHGGIAVDPPLDRRDRLRGLVGALGKVPYLLGSSVIEEMEGAPRQVLDRAAAGVGYDDILDREARGNLEGCCGRTLPRRRGGIAARGLLRKQRKRHLQRKQKKKWCRRPRRESDYPDIPSHTCFQRTWTSCTEKAEHFERAEPGAAGCLQKTHSGIRAIDTTSRLLR